MNLKQQFLDTLPLILPSIADGESEIVHDNEAYAINENKSLEICDFKHECLSSDVGLNCYECLHRNDAACMYRRIVEVDLTLENYPEDFCRYYCFGQKPVKDNLGYITYINTRKQLFDALTALKLEVERWQKFCFEQYEKQEALREYAQEFFEDLNAKLKLPIFTNILPITFYPDSCKDESYTAKKVTAGRLCACNKQSNIEIYFCGDKDIEAVQGTVRHEIIHYYLWACDLKYKDDTAVFHALCELFDGGAYIPMSKHEQRLFNRYKRIVKFYNKYETPNNSNVLKNFINENQMCLALELGSTSKNKPYNGCTKMFESYMKDRLAADKFLQKVASGNTTPDEVEAFCASLKIAG